MAKTRCLKRYWNKKLNKFALCMKPKGHWFGCGG